MNRESKFMWPAVIGTLLVMCLLPCGLCGGSVAVPLYAVPEISETQAEELRHDADRILKQAKSATGDGASFQELPPGQRPASVVSLHPSRVELYQDELFIYFDPFLGLSRGVVILPEGVDEPPRQGMFQFQRLHSRVYRFVIWPD